MKHLRATLDYLSLAALVSLTTLVLAPATWLAQAVCRLGALYTGDPALHADWWDTTRAEDDRWFAKSITRRWPALGPLLRLLTVPLGALLLAGLLGGCHTCPPPVVTEVPVVDPTLTPAAVVLGPGWDGRESCPKSCACCSLHPEPLKWDDGKVFGRVVR